MDIVKGGKEYFNKKYIKDHPYYLFIYEDTLEEETFEDFSNVFPIPTFDNEGDYFIDDEIRKTTKIINDSIENIERNLKRKKYKKVIFPEVSIGKGESDLYKESPKIYKYIKEKLNDLVESIENMEHAFSNRKRKENRYYRTHKNRFNFGRFNNSRKKYPWDRNETRKKYPWDRNDSFQNNRYKYNFKKYNYGRSRFNNSFNNRNYMRKKTKKELKELQKLKKKGKGHKKTTITTLEDASIFSQKRCNDCVKYKKLLKKKLSKKEKKADKIMSKLTQAEKKCIECDNLCKFMKGKISKDMKDYDIYESRFPRICIEDEYGIKRVDKLRKSYRKKILQQIDKLDMNNSNNSNNSE